MKRKFFSFIVLCRLQGACALSALAGVSYHVARFSSYINGGEVST